jgi:hypothetical protein
MKKFAISSALLLVVAGFAATLYLTRLDFKESALGDESRRYADQAIIAVASNWDKRELLERGSEELLQAAQFQVDLDSQFARWSALGSMLKYAGVTGAAKIGFSLQIGSIVTAQYTAVAQFQHGEAQMQIGLVKRGGGWQIASFQVFPRFSPQRPALPPANIKQL